MTALTDDALRTLIRTDAAAGWRAFIDQYTPLLVGLIRRAGLIDRDEVMEVYVAICEQLSARGFERLKSQDATRGSIGGWLAVVARHAVVDWIRSQKGRRRLFQAVRDLSPFDQQVFELYYWDEQTPSEIAEMLPHVGDGSSLQAVFDALARIDATLTDRHRADLLALAARSRAPVPIDETDVIDRVADPRDDPERAMRTAQIADGLDAALRSLSADDAAIVRLRYVEGLTTTQVQRALGFSRLTAERIQEALDRLRAALRTRGVEAHVP